DFFAARVAHRDGRHLDGQSSLSGHSGHGLIFIAQRSVANAERIDSEYQEHTIPKNWERVPCVREAFARKSSCSASVRRCSTPRTSRLWRKLPLRRGSTSRKRQLPTCIVRSGPKRSPHTNSSNTISSVLRLITAPASEAKSIRQPASCSAK